MRGAVFASFTKAENLETLEILTPRVLRLETLTPLALRMGPGADEARSR